MGLGQYNSPGEYCGLSTASSVFLILVPMPQQHQPPGPPQFPPEICNDKTYDKHEGRLKNLSVLYLSFSLHNSQMFVCIEIIKIVPLHPSKGLLLQADKSSKKKATTSIVWSATLTDDSHLQR